MNGMHSKTYIESRPTPGVRRYHNFIVFVSKAFTMTRLVLPIAELDRTAG